MFGIGGFELFIILIFGFLIFGPDKLPDIARTVGKGIARFREAQQDMNETLGADKLFDPNNPDQPFKDPIEALDNLAKRQEEKRRAKEGGSPVTNAAQDSKPADAKAETTAATDAKPAAVAAEDKEPAKQESFTERKARYERERAARKAAEAEASASGAAAADGMTEAPAAAAAEAAASEGGAE